jgi:hypothetical protein
MVGRNVFAHASRQHTLLIAGRSVHLSRTKSRAVAGSVYRQTFKLESELCRMIAKWNDGIEPGLEARRDAMPRLA